jgi:hypothetical protein
MMMMMMMMRRARWNVMSIVLGGEKKKGIVKEECTP